MENAELYANLTNFNDVATFSLNVCIFLIVANIFIYGIHFVLSKKQNYKKKENGDKRIGAIECVGIIVLLILLVSFIFSLFYFEKLNFLTTILGVPTTLMIIYTVYIKPLIFFKQEPFKYNYVQYGLFLTIYLFVISKVNYLEAFQKMDSEGSAQVIVIIMVFLQTYTTLYCLLVNFYFLLKNISKFNFIKVENFFNNIYMMLKERFSDDVIKLKYKYSNELLATVNKKKFIIFIVPYFIFDTLLCLFILIVSLLFSFLIEPIYSILSPLIKFILKIYSSNENQINYGISKIVSVIALVSTYMLIQLNNKETYSVFQPRIISTYEFIATAILIPIILDGLMTIKDKLKLQNKNNM